MERLTAGLEQQAKQHQQQRGSGNTAAPQTTPVPATNANGAKKNRRGRPAKKAAPVENQEEQKDSNVEMKSENGQEEKKPAPQQKQQRGKQNNGKQQNQQQQQQKNVPMYQMEGMNAGPVQNVG